VPEGGKTFPEMLAGKLMPKSYSKRALDGYFLWILLRVYLKLKVTTQYLLCVIEFTKRVSYYSYYEGDELFRFWARLYRDHVWKLHGLPNTVISDRGPQFASGFMKELNKILGIDTKLSTAYHPQTDGQTERMNQELEQYLRMFVDYRQTNWPEWLGNCRIFHIIIKFKNQLKYHHSTLTTGFNPQMGFEPQRDIKVQAVEEFVKELRKIQEEAGSCIT